MATAKRIGRMMTFAAQPGRGGELAEALLEVAGGLRDAPGCEVYVINHDREDADTVRVMEVWVDQASADAALAAAAESPSGVSVHSVLGMLAGPPQRVDLVALGGVGLGGVGLGT